VAVLNQRVLMLPRPAHRMNHVKIMFSPSHCRLACFFLS